MQKKGRKKDDDDDDDGEELTTRMVEEKTVENKRIRTKRNERTNERASECKPV